MRKYNCILLITIYFLFMINYNVIISKYFNYLGFNQNFFSLYKLVLATVFTLEFILLYVFLKKEFYKIVYTVFLVSIFYGQSIYYIFNESKFILLVYMGIPLIVIFIIEKLDTARTNSDIKLKLSDKFTLFIFILLVLTLIVPYFKYYKLINWKNLLLQDVYETRFIFREYSSGILGYLFSPISRVILPFLLVYSLENKKRMVTIVSTISIIMMYLLNGALKSIIFGFLACIFFYKGDYAQKESRFLKTMVIGNLLCLLEVVINKTWLIADYMRRLFFVPARLFQVYYDYFNERHTYFLHSKLSKILGINAYEGSLSLFVGEQVLDVKGLNANTGIFCEGFISFGTVGVIIAAMIFGLIILYLNRRKLSPSYFGIFFSFIYVINTSFLETLFITHGLLFYLIFAKFIIPKEINVTKS